MSSFRHDGLRGGIWHGIIEGGARPAELALVHRGERIGPATMTPMPGDEGWQIAAPVPLERLTDGATTFMLVEDGEAGQLAPGAAIIARLPLIAGAEIAGELQSELALIRAEMDLLLREFRRQSIATSAALREVANRSEIEAATTAADTAIRTAEDALRTVNAVIATGGPVE